MMTWNDILHEMQEAEARERSPQHDPVRRAKIAEVERISQIPLVVYATDFTDSLRASQNGASVQIDLNDKTGFLQALSDIEGGPLDVLLHSPGGSPTATESIVHLLRSRFEPIRFIVPHTAKSAATMLALSGNEVLLGESAELGPIDPQMRLMAERGPVTVPARAAIDQFSLAGSELVKNPDKAMMWLTVIRQYAPSLLQECLNAISLSEQLVTEWLQDYMFRGEPDARNRAEKIAKWLADHNNFRDHSRPVWMEQLLELEPSVKIERLKDAGEEFEDAVMALYWAIDVTFSQTNASKLIEHRDQSAYVVLVQTVALQQSIQNQPNRQRGIQRQESRRRNKQSRKRRRH